MKYCFSSAAENISWDSCKKRKQNDAVIPLDFTVVLFYIVHRKWSKRSQIPRSAEIGGYVMFRYLFKSIFAFMDTQLLQDSICTGRLMKEMHWFSRTYNQKRESFDWLSPQSGKRGLPASFFHSWLFGAPNSHPWSHEKRFTGTSESIQ